MKPLEDTLVVDFSWYRLAARQLDPDAQEELAAPLAERVAPRPLAEWLELFEGEDVCAAPVLSLEEAAAGLAAEEPAGHPAPVGRDADACRRELALA